MFRNIYSKNPSVWVGDSCSYHHYPHTIFLLPSIVLLLLLLLLLLLPPLHSNNNDSHYYSYQVHAQPSSPPRYRFKCGVNKDIFLPEQEGLITNQSLARSISSSSGFCEEVIIGPNVTLRSIVTQGSWGFDPATNTTNNVPHMNSLIIEGVKVQKIKLLHLKFEKSRNNNDKKPSLIIRNNQIITPRKWYRKSDVNDLSFSSLIFRYIPSPFQPAFNASSPSDTPRMVEGWVHEIDYQHTWIPLGLIQVTNNIVSSPPLLSVLEPAEDGSGGAGGETTTSSTQVHVLNPQAVYLCWLIADKIDVSFNHISAVNVQTFLFVRNIILESSAISNNVIVQNDEECESFKVNTGGHDDGIQCIRGKHLRRQDDGLEIPSGQTIDFSDNTHGPITSSDSSSFDFSNNNINVRAHDVDMTIVRSNFVGNFSNIYMNNNLIDFNLQFTPPSTTNGQSNSFYFFWMAVIAMNYYYGAQTQVISASGNTIHGWTDFPMQTMETIGISPLRQYYRFRYLPGDDDGEFATRSWRQLNIHESLSFDHNNIQIFSHGGQSVRGINIQGTLPKLKAVSVSYNFFNLSIEDGSALPPGSYVPADGGGGSGSGGLLPDGSLGLDELIFVSSIIFDLQTDLSPSSSSSSSFNQTDFASSIKSLHDWEEQRGAARVTINNNIIVQFLWVDSDQLIDLVAMTLIPLSVDSVRNVNYQSLIIDNNQMFLSGRVLRAAGIRVILNVISKELSVKNNTLNTNGDSPLFPQKSPIRFANPNFINYERILALLGRLGEILTATDQQQTTFFDLAFKGIMLKSAVVSDNTFSTSVQPEAKNVALCLLRFKPDLNATLQETSIISVTSFGGHDNLDNGDDDDLSPYSREALLQLKSTFLTQLTMENNHMEVKASDLLKEKESLDFKHLPGLIDGSIASRASLFWSSTVARPLHSSFSHESSSLTIRNNRLIAASGQHSPILLLNSTFNSIVIENNFVNVSQTGNASTFPQFWISRHATKIFRDAPTQSVFYSSSDSFSKSISVQNNHFEVTNNPFASYNCLFTCGAEPGVTTVKGHQNSNNNEQQGICTGSESTIIKNNNFILKYHSTREFDTRWRMSALRGGFESTTTTTAFRKIYLVNITTTLNDEGRSAGMKSPFVIVEQNKMDMYFQRQHPEESSSSSSSSSLFHASIINLVGSFMTRNQDHQSRSTSPPIITVRNNKMSYDAIMMSSAGTSPSVNDSSLINCSFVSAQHHSVVGLTTSAISNEQELQAYYSSPSLPRLDFINNRMILTNFSSSSFIENRQSAATETKIDRTKTDALFYNIQNWAPFRYENNNIVSNNNNNNNIYPLFFRINVSSPNPNCNVISAKFSDDTSADKDEYYYEASIDLEKVRDFYYFNNPNKRNRILTFQEEPTTEPITTSTTVSPVFDNGSSSTNSSSSQPPPELSTTSSTTTQQPFSPHANFIFSSDSDENICYKTLWEKYNPEQDNHPQQLSTPLPNNNNSDNNDFNGNLSALAAALELFLRIENRRPPPQDTHVMLTINNIVQGISLFSVSVAAGSLALPAFAFSVARHQAVVNYVRGAAQSTGADCTGLLPIEKEYYHQSSSSSSKTADGNNNNNNDPSSSSSSNIDDANGDIDRDMIDGASIADSPTQLIFGNSRLRYLVGQSVGNLVYCLVLFFLGQIVANIIERNDTKAQREKQEEEERRKQQRKAEADALLGADDEAQLMMMMAARSSTFSSSSSSASFSDFMRKQRDVFSTKSLSVLVLCLFALFTCPTLIAGFISVASSSPSSSSALPFSSASSSSASSTVDAHPISAGEKALAVTCGLLFAIFAVLFVAWALFIRHPRQEEFKAYSNRKNTTNSSSSSFQKIRKYFFMGEGEWLLKPKKKKSSSKQLARPAFDENGNATSFFTEIDLRVEEAVHMKFAIASVCLESFGNKAASWFCMFEIAVQVLLAVASLVAQLVPIGASCLAHGILLLFILGLHFCLTVFRRPYRVRFAQIFIPLNTFVSFALVAVTLITSMMEQNSIGASSEMEMLMAVFAVVPVSSRPLMWLMTILIIPIILNGLVSVVLLVFAVVPVISWRRKLKEYGSNGTVNDNSHQDDDDDKAEHHQRQHRQQQDRRKRRNSDTTQRHSSSSKEQRRHSSDNNNKNRYGNRRHDDDDDYNDYNDRDRSRRYDSKNRNNKNYEDDSSQQRREQHHHHHRSHQQRRSSTSLERNDSSSSFHGSSHHHSNQRRRSSDHYNHHHHHSDDRRQSDSLNNGSFRFSDSGAEYRHRRPSSSSLSSPPPSPSASKRARDVTNTSGTKRSPDIRPHPSAAAAASSSSSSFRRRSSDRDHHDYNNSGTFDHQHRQSTSSDRRVDKNDHHKNNNNSEHSSRDHHHHRGGNSDSRSSYPRRENNTSASALSSSSSRPKSTSARDSNSAAATSRPSRDNHSTSQYHHRRRPHRDDPEL